jgi:microcystin-dependent protein
MGLESGTFISDLVVTNPAATDGLSQADDHLRLIKNTIKNTFPNIAGAVDATHTELSVLDGDTTATATTLADADRLVVNDNGVMAQVALSDLKTYLTANLPITSAMITDGTIQSGDIGDEQITQAKLAADVIPIPVGSLIPFAGSTAPNGYLLCYGQLVSRTTYSGLFAAIGTTYGAGDGVTTFRLPDLRGRVISGFDAMGGNAASRLTSIGTALGDAGGSETHTLTESELAAHRHLAVKDGSRGATGGYTALTSSNSIIRYSIDPDYTQPQENATSYSLEGISGDADIGRTSETGDNSPHANVQPTIMLNYIIKT